MFLLLYNFLKKLFKIFLKRMCFIHKHGHFGACYTMYGEFTKKKSKFIVIQNIFYLRFKVKYLRKSKTT